MDSGPNDNDPKEPLYPEAGSPKEEPNPFGSTSRFNVRKVEPPSETPSVVVVTPTSPASPTSKDTSGVQFNAGDESVQIDPGRPLVNKDGGDDGAYCKDGVPLSDNEEVYSNHMALYEDDITRQGRISSILSSINNYHGGVAPNVSDVDNQKPKQKNNLGTLLGVYLPCIQNIFGVLLYVRLTWIVGMAGALEAFLIVAICCAATLLTAFSMSAIATNGVVPGGGSYFMISRALGPEFGGAVGVLFYLGTSVASSMYIVGAVEILIKYIAPSANVLGDVNCYRLYGTIIMLMLSTVVFVGVAFVSIFAAISLACVVISIICIYIGIFVSSSTSGVEICMLGDYLLNSDDVSVNGTMHCTKNLTGPMYEHFCGRFNDTGSYCEYFKRKDVHARLLEGIPGIASGEFVNNVFNKHTEMGNVVGTDITGDPETGQIVAEITTSFMVLLAIYFPSVTGIMAGSNRSGDLKDAQKSIPIGTIGAILTTSSVYMTCVFFFAACINGNLLRDKYGVSLGGRMIIGELAWPSEWVILIGAFLSTLGAGLQTLTGAPRLLQAISNDGVIPFLKFFQVTTKRGEPFRALLLTSFISLLGILIGRLDYIAPVITMFFLMCYGFVNMACAVLTLLQTPNWRPRFKYYHWTMSLLGLSICIVLMFISSWYYALIAIFIAGVIYKYIEYKGAEQEWGDGIRGLAMSAARYSLLRLQSGPPHTKNWRPQLLVLMKMDQELQPKYPKLVGFASQLKAGKGLCLVNSVLEGQFKDRFPDAQACKQTLDNLIKEYHVKGFSDVSVSVDVIEGLCQLIQNAGLGGLKHNTVVMGWPYGWRHSTSESSFKVFLETVKNVNAAHMALLVTKGINMFPDHGVKLRGTIDVWWIVHDGGLLMLLPFLLRQNRSWKNCKIRIFTVAQSEDNSIQMKKDLKQYLYQLRIEADVDVVEMSNQDISAYTYERTLMMEQRTDILTKIRSQQRNNAIPEDHSPTAMQVPTITLSPVPEESSTDVDPLEQNLKTLDKSQFTFTPQDAKNLIDSKKKPDKLNVRRMHTAVRLNEHIVEKSHTAQLVVLNLPAPPKTVSGDQNYMEFLEVLTEGLDRVLMVRGSGREVITIYS